MRDDIIAALARATIYPYNKAKYRKYQATLADAPALAERNLLQLVKRHSETDFGRAHNFASIDSIGAYRSHVPITTYATLRPYFEAVADGHPQALFPASERILDFCCTTGTTGTPKVLPVTRSWLDTYQQHWRIWGVKALMDHPGILHKKWLQISGSTRISRTARGRDIGSISAITARYQNPVVKFGFAAPHEVGDISDADTRNYTLIRLAITRSVGFIITITASNLIGLAELSDRYKEVLIRDLHDGTLSIGKLDANSANRRLLSMVSEKDPERARELERIVGATGTLYPKDFWQLELIACWTGGTVGYQARNLCKYYGNTPIRDVGYTSTEGRHTIPIDDFTPNGSLVAGGGFYEFAGANGGEALTATELVKGETYSVIITSAQGLYRYRMGDYVRCHGFEQASPILEFLCKDEQYSDLEGEKVTGDQIAHSVAAGQAALALGASEFGAIPVRPNQGPAYYAFLLEPFAQGHADLERQLITILDTELAGQNFLYRYKRGDGSLAPARLFIVEPGTFAARARAQIARAGTGDTQYKHPALLKTELLADLKILRTVDINVAAQGGPVAAA